MYTDWLLNSSIAKNFDAFKKGFDLVMRQVPLADLFTAEEVELLVCGSNVSRRGREGEGGRGEVMVRKTELGVKENWKSIWCVCVCVCVEGEKVHVCDEEIKKEGVMIN